MQRFLKIILSIVLIYFLQSVSSLQAQNDIIDSLELELSTIDNSKDSIQKLIDLSWYYGLVDKEKSLARAETALAIAEEIKDTTQVLRATNLIGFSFIYTDDSPIGIQLLKKAEQLAEYYGKSYEIGINAGFLGVAYYGIGNLDSSLYYHFKSRDYCLEVCSACSCVITAMSNIANKYRFLKQYDEALAIFQKLWVLAQKDKENIHQLLDTERELGTAYLNLHRYDSAYYHLNHALEAVKRHNINDLLAIIQVNLGRLHLEQGKYKEAFQFLDLAEQNAIRLDVEKADVYYQKARYYYKTKEYTKAETEALKALDYNESSNFKLGMMQCYEVLKDIYTASGKHKEAVEYYQKHEELQSRHFSLTTNTRSIETNLKLQRAQKEKELALKNIELQRLNEVNTRNRFIAIMSFIIFLGLILIAFYQYRLSNIKKEEALKQELALNFHDNTANTINGINRIAQIIREQKLSKAEQDLELERISALSNDALSSISDIIWSLNHKEGQVKDLVDKVIEFVDQSSVTEKIPFSVFTAPQLDLSKKIDGNTRHQLLMILKEAVMNAIKHTYPTKINATFEENNSLFDINITNWFKDRRYNEFSSGIGLKNIEKRVLSLGGKIQINDNEKFFELKIKI